MESVYMSKTFPIVWFHFCCHHVNLNPVTPERKQGENLREEYRGMLGHHEHGHSGLLGAGPLV